MKTDTEERERWEYGVLPWMFPLKNVGSQGVPFVFFTVFEEKKPLFKDKKEHLGVLNIYVSKENPDFEMGENIV